MCDVCGRDIYFDKTHYHSDAGYGDDDWTETEQYKVMSFICPACGRLKPLAVSLFGSEEKALMYIMSLNMSDEVTDAECIGQFKEMLQVSKMNRFEKVLENNDLSYENGKITHSCGHTLLSGIQNINKDYSMVLKIEGILKGKGFNFCPSCGKKIVPFSRELEMKPSEFLCFPVVNRK